MRDIDRIIQVVQDDPNISPVHKRILINRIEPWPTQEEVDRARAEVYPDPDSMSAWSDS